MVNDEFSNYSGSSKFSLKIIDKWGKELFQTTDPINGWKGENAGAGTYFFLMSLGESLYKGWLPY
jgi:hypothetical protein